MSLKQGRNFGQITSRMVRGKVRLEGTKMKNRRGGNNAEEVRKCREIF